MAQTAVEWLVNQINGHSHSIGMPYSMSIRIDIPDDIIEQAKEMEKEQIKKAMMHTFAQQNTLPYGMEYLLKRDGMLEDFENYYNETYNNGL